MVNNFIQRKTKPCTSVLYTYLLDIVDTESLDQGDIGILCNEIRQFLFQGRLRDIMDHLVTSVNACNSTPCTVNAKVPLGYHPELQDPYAHTAASR